MSNLETVSSLTQKLHPLFVASRGVVVGKQKGVPTFFNVVLRTLIDKLAVLPPDAIWRESIDPNLHQILSSLCSVAERLSEGRFIGWQNRKISVGKCRDITDHMLAYSQGVLECVHWKGMPVFKTAYEFSLYSMMIWELKPATILEFGSGQGASAIWFADLLSQFNYSTHVYSVDIHPPDLEYEGVTFLERDVNHINEWMPSFSDKPKPWLVIEDAHVNIPGVLNCLNDYLIPNDYMVVEDSSSKQFDIDKFMGSNGHLYRVDTRYVDYFGLNVTSSLNSVFKRVA